MITQGNQPTNKEGEVISVDEMMTELQAAAKPIRKAFMQKELGKKQIKRDQAKRAKQARKSHRGNSRGR